MDVRKLILALVLLTMPLQAQWSTTSNVDSVLFVCPGFFPGIVTYEDGSSLVLGALIYGIYAQKLDEYGRWQWPNPTFIQASDSSLIGAGLLPIDPWGGWVSDKDGGVIFYWYDHRESYRGEYGLQNNAIYAQRVDKDGTVRWPSGGLKVKDAQTGRTLSSGIVSDGQGGCLIAWTDDGYDYPGAPNRSSITVLRLSGEGLKLWEVELDSAQGKNSFYYKTIARLEERVLVQFYGSPLKLLDLSGSLIVPEHPVLFGAMTTADSTIYNAVSLGPPREVGDTSYYLTGYSRFSRTFDTLYAFTGEVMTFWDFYSYPTPIVADGQGGFYNIDAFAHEDSTVKIGYISLQHADKNGIWPEPLLITGADRPFGASAPDGSLLLFNAKAGQCVQRYSTSGQAMWPEPVKMLSPTGMWRISPWLRITTAA